MARSKGGRDPEGLAAEQRLSRIIGVLAVAAAIIGFATIIVQLSALEPNTSGRAAELRNFDDSRGLALIGTALRVLSLLLIIPISNFLYDAIRRREPTAPPYVKQLGIVAPILMALVAVLGTIAIIDVVDQFLDLPAGERDNDRAEQLNDDSTLITIQSIGVILTGVVFAGWLAVICAGGMGVGLLPRFLAYFGYGVAALTIFAPLPSTALLVGFVFSLALLMLDRWPGGRPLAWETGKAEPPV